MFFVGLSALFWVGCSIFATRPVQEMSYGLAAIKAAKEVQADTYAPELFRLANEWFFRAKNEYKFKNFKLAKEYADKARHFAEQAEFESVRGGAVRSEGADAMTPPPVPAQGEEHRPGDAGSGVQPTPTGTPIESYDQRKAEEDAKHGPAPASTTPNPAPAGGAPTPPR